MPFVKSRVNGLLVAIPNDARNVIHRFAVHGGGNELVFEPITRKDFNASKASETAPLGLGEPDGPEQAPLATGSTRENAVELTIGVAEDEDEDDAVEVAPAIAKPTRAEAVATPTTKRPKRPATRKASPSTDDIII